jgi:tRNA 2-selenouridine synthase
MDKIQPKDLAQFLEDRTLIDVRAPAEYAHAHIPHALSLPLFNDEERARVGTAYKQVSPENALLKGLEFVGPKMSGFVKKAIKWSPNRKVVVHCWRGGKRSGSMSWLLRFAGFDVVTLEGGYKNYRNFVLQAFENQQLNLVVLGGKTGSGKTQILHELARQGEQILDLEGIAHHKGSAFGWIGEKTQPTSEQFENNLYEALRLLDPSRRVWVENESHSIGGVFIPQAFWVKMKAAPLLHLEVAFEQRVQHLVAVYTATSKADLRVSFEKITKKLGLEATKNAINALEMDDYATAAAIGLKYYDKTYMHCFDTNSTLSKNVLDVEDWNIMAIAEKIKNYHF